MIDLSVLLLDHDILINLLDYYLRGKAIFFIEKVLFVFLKLLLQCRFVLFLANSPKSVLIWVTISRQTHCSITCDQHRTRLRYGDQSTFNCHYHCYHRRFRNISSIGFNIHNINNYYRVQTDNLSSVYSAPELINCTLTRLSVE